MIPLKRRHVDNVGRHKIEEMERQSIWRLLFRYSAPAMASEMVGASYILVDSIFVGFLGPEALAALAVANPLMLIYRSIGMGIAVGTSSLVSRNLGAEKKEEVNRAAGNSITLFFIASALTTAVCLSNLKTLLQLFGASESVLSLAMSYMTVETWFISLDFFLIALVVLVGVQGNPVIASVSMITSGVVSCIFDPILIWGFGPFPAFGIAGAALATSVGRGTGAAIIILYLASGRSRYRLRPSHFLPNFATVTEISVRALMVRVNAAFVAQILEARIAASFGVIPLAVSGVLSRASNFAFQPCWGIGQGMVQLIGYNLGARKRDRVGEVVTKAALSGFLWGVLCFAVAMLFGHQVMSLFGTGPDYLAVATTALRIYALGFFGVGVHTVLSFFFQGIGARTLVALVVSFSRQFLFLIPFILILPNRFGLIGLWAAHAVADMLAVVFSLTLTGITFRGLGITFHLRSSIPSSESARRELIPPEPSDAKRTNSSSVVLDRGEWLAFMADVRNLAQAYEDRARALTQRKAKEVEMLYSYRALCSYCGTEGDTRDRYCRVCGRIMHSQCA